MKKTQAVTKIYRPNTKYSAKDYETFKLTKKELESLTTVK